MSCEFFQDNNFPVLKIEDGFIRGRKQRTVDTGKEYFSFQGIPYAKPPVGELRFKVTYQY